MADHLRLPSPRLIDGDSVPSLRWGVMGPGGIATKWVGTVLANTRQRVVAVGSSNAERATGFAEKFGIPRAYGSYDDLLADPTVDIVYVSTRQHVHRDNVLQCLAAGKHVLVEKPLATTASDARDIHDAARASGLFVMEALWTAYLPQSDIIRQVMNDRLLGEFRYAQADFGQDLRDRERLFDPHGGGTSHDLGIYSTSFVSSVAPGPWTSLSAIGEASERGVDTRLTIQTSYDGGGSALATSTTLGFSPTDAWVSGTDSSLRVDAPFILPTGLSLLSPTFPGEVVDRWVDPFGFVAHEALFYQANAAASYIADNLTESPVRGLDASLADIETLTEARQLIGVQYLGE